MQIQDGASCEMDSRRGLVTLWVVGGGGRVGGGYIVTARIIKRNKTAMHFPTYKCLLYLFEINSFNIFISMQVWYD